MERTCPPDHIEYLSEMLAENALTLHDFMHPGCVGIQKFRCGDHWHIGHAPGTRHMCPQVGSPA